LFVAQLNWLAMEQKAVEMIALFVRSAAKATIHC